MNYLSNSRSTKELQNIDLNHHFHPFTSTSDIKDGARIIKEGKGIYLWDSREKAEQFYNEEWKIRIKELFGETPMLEYLDCSIVIDNETKEVRNLVTA